MSLIIKVFQLFLESLFIHEHHSITNQELSCLYNQGSDCSLLFIMSLHKFEQIRWKFLIKLFSRPTRWNNIPIVSYLIIVYCKIILSQFSASVYFIELWSMYETLFKFGQPSWSSQSKGTLHYPFLVIFHPSKLLLFVGFLMLLLKCFISPLLILNNNQNVKESKNLVCIRTCLFKFIKKYHVRMNLRRSSVSKKFLFF